ncbi:MAG: DMT family transporter [Pseudomonadota bacterium]
MSDAAQVKADNVKLAVAVILVTVMALALGDALIKKISADLVLWQIFVLRGLVAVPLLAGVLGWRFKGVSFWPRAVAWTAARSLMLVMMWVAYYAALPHVPLAAAAAAYYTLPIFITLFSACFVGERVGPLGWIAVILGFAGVLLILRPAADDFNAYALLPLVSAVLYALAMILTRTKCRGEHPLILSLALNVSFVAVGLAATGLMSLEFGMGPEAGKAASFLSAQWAAMGLREIAAIALLALIIMVGSVGAAIAYQSGPSSVVATFDFAYVGFAVVFGFLFFSEIPDWISLAGTALIVVAGIMTLRK